jgi:ATP-binding cassette subfamily C protein PrsD
MFRPSASPHSDLAEALRDCPRASASVFVFSGLVNLLILAGPLYMLQVYDRVLSSRRQPQKGPIEHDVDG